MQPPHIGHEQLRPAHRQDCIQELGLAGLEQVALTQRFEVQVPAGVTACAHDKVAVYVGSGCEGNGQAVMLLLLLFQSIIAKMSTLTSLSTS